MSYFVVKPDFSGDMLVLVYILTLAAMISVSDFGK